MTIQETARFLREHDHYLILTHVRPDGDTVGCAAALCRGLRQLGKQAHVLYNRECTSLYSNYLEGLIAPEGYVPETVVSVDIAARGLFPENAQLYLDRVDLAVDHHPSQEFFAKNTCLDGGRAACGELIFDILKELGPISVEMATALYVAVSTDCGCFVYGNTTAGTHRTAAELMELGIDAAALNKRHFRTKSATRMKLEGLLTSQAQLFDDGTIVMGAVTLDMMASLGATERDADDISALLGQMEGVKTAVTIREQAPDRCKISLRTDPADLNASTVCATFGGGGHTAAAGATLAHSVADTMQLVLDAIHKVKEGCAW